MKSVYYQSNSERVAGVQYKNLIFTRMFSRSNLFLMAMVMLLFTLLGCGVLGSLGKKKEAKSSSYRAYMEEQQGSGSADAPAFEQPGDEPTADGAGTSGNQPDGQNGVLTTTQELRVIDQYFFQEGTKVFYSFVVENPDLETAAYTTTYRVEIRDYLGEELFQTDEVTLRLHMPGHFLGVTDEVELADGQDAGLISVLPETASWSPMNEIAATDTEEPLPQQILTVADAYVQDVSNNIAFGTIQNTYDQHISNIQVFAIAYNLDNEIVGGGVEFIDVLPENGEQNVTIQMHTEEEPNGGVALFPTLSDSSAFGDNVSVANVDDVTSSEDMDLNATAPIITDTLSDTHAQTTTDGLVADVVADLATTDVQTSTDAPDAPDAPSVSMPVSQADTAEQQTIPLPPTPTTAPVATPTPTPASSGATTSADVTATPTTASSSLSGATATATPTADPNQAATNTPQSTATKAATSSSQNNTATKAATNTPQQKTATTASTPKGTAEAQTQTADANISKTSDAKIATASTATAEKAKQTQTAITEEDFETATAKIEQETKTAESEAKTSEAKTADVPTDTPEPIATEVPTDTPEPTGTPAPTDTPVPTDTPTPEPVMPSGECADNAPDEIPNGPIAWMPNTSPDIGSSTTVCAWLVMDNAPIEAAKVHGSLLYLDMDNTPRTVDINQVTTDATGIAKLSFNVPETTECEIEVIVEHDGKTYDWSSVDYGDDLYVQFNPSGMEDES